MEEKCCCGCCSLYTATGVGLLWTMAETWFYVRNLLSCIWNSFVLARSPVNGSELQSFCMLKILQSCLDNYVESIFGIVVNVWLLLLMSESAVFNPFRLCVDIDTIEDFDVFHGIVLAALGLNAFWLAFGLLASVGNITQSHGRLTPWLFLTYLITVLHFGVSIYFAIKFQDSFHETSKFYENGGPSKKLTYLTLLTIYSGGGLMLVFNFYIAHVVEMRGKEIDKDYTALLFYILSHMNRCSRANGDVEQNLLPQAPPSYDQVPPYLPPQIYMRTTESSGSSWSLSCEALKTMSNAQLDELNTAYAVNNCGRNIGHARNLSTLMGRNDGYQPLNVDANDSAALPY